MQEKSSGYKRLHASNSPVKGNRLWTLIQLQKQLVSATGQHCKTDFKHFPHTTSQAMQHVYSPVSSHIVSNSIPLI